MAMMSHITSELALACRALAALVPIRLPSLADEREFRMMLAPVGKPLLRRDRWLM
jgi:hypothetical protein